MKKKSTKKRWGYFKPWINQNENPEYYYNIGYIKTAQNKYYEAIEAFSKATRLDRLFVKAYKAMAMVYKAVGAVEISGRVYPDRSRNLYGYR